MQPNELQSSALARAERPDLYRRWGVLPGPWLWTTHLRILFVLDGRIDTGRGSGCFGLGLVLDTLLDDSFAWWVRFGVDVVRRDDGTRRKCPDADPYESEEDFNFQFTDPGFNLDDYDQVWFFGDFPANEPDDPSDAMYSPLSDAELKLLAEWMDRGGGVFATGDHYNLGASMCSRIPRVRTMRKWTAADGVPPQNEPSRHETTQLAPGSTITTYANEEDAFPQPIEPVYRATATSIAIRTYVPHPLLCASEGVIDKFPDHMHEGEVVADDAVELDRPLGIPGYAGVEYPPAVDPTQSRPQPQVVAYGRTTSLVQHESGPVNPKRFPLIGAYDGDPAEIGRVVVDSTWHHWFSLNLHGLRDGNRPVYELMQAYYRNVALWLATPAQRASMLFASTWGVVVSDPMAFPVALRRNLWQVGERAVDVIGRTASQCTLYGLVVSWLDAKAVEALWVPTKLAPSAPCPSCLPQDLVVRAIVGGVATSLLEPALEYHQKRHRKRPLLDPERIVRRAAEGAELGYRALLETTRESVSAGERLARVLDKGFRPLPPESIPVPVELLQVRVVAERLQLPDPKDPVLVDGRFTLTIRMRLGGSVVASDVIEELEVPPLEHGGALVDLDRVLYEGVVQSGELLLLQVVAGAAGREPVPPGRVRFRDRLGGHPSTWIGGHVPSSAQPWRLWYRIERREGGPEADDEQA
jgi:hypothetical protein